MTGLPDESTRILVVEDNSRHAGLMRDEIEAEMPTATVRLVTTVAGAREALAEGQFDLCLLDFQLPDGDGLEVLRSIREDEREEAVVLVTTSTSPEVAVEAMKIGAEDYIVKEEGYVSILPFVIREVLERVRMRSAHAALERRLARAEHLASLNTLMAGIAHNLNNPLTTVRTFLELLPERYETDEEFRTEYYALVLTELKRIRALIQSMMQAVAIPLSGGEAPWPMPELLRELELYVQGSTTEKGIHYVARSGDDLPLVLAGREAVKQALVILLDNAMAFSPQGGSVEVSVRSTREPGGEARIHIEVSDGGEGVSEEHRTKIFEPFYSTRSGGLGIGLFVAQCVARAHGGSLEVAGRDPQGAVFTLRLPGA
ncbi:MAG: response regulator [Candidatus Binatia bacterium]|nr:response regulator [Candidatus Binatia bacterium]